MLSGGMRACGIALHVLIVDMVRLTSVGGTVIADREGGGFQLGHAEFVEQSDIGGVGADRRQRIRRRARESCRSATDFAE
jgi:hypothetical protein